ncbi:Holliday junction branch migration protein RuvA [Salinibacterium sp. G-O1]|uniref:Holliday junction branch migration protein RuvA n=1 Tax=Salinibacterium sp. G-O1 TaxID=3046208 RepID=UPI0024B8B657|nr:Holliday junction branch migration protein RuvA [Salinibacterium sp. G-O1]MDJ0335219.1 Holliday junction branch migration protein RuvA [Salinibacterium sp. G-O1]
MISSLRGTVLAAIGSTVVIEVGGVGLSVQVTPQLALSLRVGSEASIRTALIVREDDLSLYGFVEADELTAFDLLRGVTGVGPKSALGVLAAMAPADIAQAVTLEDDAAFRKVSGIGPKTAKLIVLSLAGKLEGMATTRAPAQARPSTVSQSVTIALVGLGWPERIAVQATEEALAQASESERNAVQSLLRLALANLGPQLAGSSS